MFPHGFLEWQPNEYVWHADAYRRTLEDFDEHVTGEVASLRPNPLVRRRFRQWELTFLRLAWIGLFTNVSITGRGLERRKLA